MKITDDEFWRMTPRYFFGLLNEYVRQTRKRNREVKPNGRPRRPIIHVKHIDEIPGFVRR